MRIELLIMSLLLVFITNCATEDPSEDKFKFINIEAHRDTTVTLKVGNTLTVRLWNNIIYNNWSYKIIGNKMRYIQSTMGDKTDNGYVDILWFEAISPGKDSIRFTYSGLNDNSFGVGVIITK